VRVRPLAPVLVGALATFALACPKEPTTTTPPTDTHEDVSARMLDHFDTVTEIKDAIIGGDLDRARELATILRDHEASAERPVDWRPHVARMVEAGGGLSEATDIASAARFTARLATACGTCHDAVAAEPVFDPGLPPQETDQPADRMRRHQWGVDRMWEGLVAPSADAWDWGAQTIGETPGCDDPAPSEAYRVSLCGRIEALARSALDARNAADRTRIYGEFLATCSGCHALDAGP
jgi:cytochrome c553